MKVYIYLLLKLIFLTTLFLGVFYILEYGFTFIPNKLLTPFLLSGLTAIMILKANLKRYILIFSVACLVLMVLAYIFNWLDLSVVLGSFGFSLLVAVIVLYCPQIIKKGYVEKF